MGAALELERRAPAPGRVALDECLAMLLRAPCGEPFDASVVEFFAKLSRRWFGSEAARAWPEVQALAYFLRRASLERLAVEFRSHGDRAPRGTVFHVPPGNVQTLSFYSWLLSALVGNRNVVRLSPRRSPVVDLLVQHLNEALSEDSSGLTQRTLLVEYDHEREISAALSGACDVRVLWGGNQTVSSLRAVPLPPRAVELTFPDRVSYAALDSRSVVALGDQELVVLAERLFNDAYWFDQRACSSPRALVFCGAPEAGLRALERLLGALKAVVDQRGYRVPTDLALSKRLYVHQLILDEGAQHLAWLSNEVVALEVPSLRALRHREHCGGGAFLVTYVGALGELADFVMPVDQTLTHVGFEPEQVHAFARGVQGCGLDRIVPVGKALEFSNLWDGYDLLQSFSRARDIRVAG